MRSSAVFLPTAVAALIHLTGGCRTVEGSPVDAGDSTDSAALVCSVGSIESPTVCPDPPPHYPDIAPIILHRCLLCHYGDPVGPWPLTQYSHVADWQDVIASDLLDCSMPPPDAGVPMTNEERTAILTWILCGFLE